MKKIFIILFAFTILLSAQDNSNLENRFRLAQTYEAAGQFDKAENIYRELNKLQPWNYTYYESLNKILIRTKKYDEAIQIAQNKIRENPQDPNIYGILGSIYFMMDDLDNANAAWEKGINTNPASYITYRVIANYAIENRAYEKAIDILKRGKMKHQDLTFFSIDLANLYAVNMDFENAALEFCEFILFQPGQLGMAKSRVSSYITRPLAAEQTIRGIRKAIEKNSSEHLYDFLVFVLQQTGDYSSAFSAIEKSDLEFKGNGTMAFTFAQDAFRDRKYDWAARTYEYMLKKYPNSPYQISARIGYAKCLEEDLNLKIDSTKALWKPLLIPKIQSENQYREIIRAYEKFMEEFKDNSMKAEALYRIGEIYRSRLLELDKADSVYQALIKFSPNSFYTGKAYIARGKIAILKNDFESSASCFTALLSQSRSDPQSVIEANYFLARLEFWKGNFTKALDELKRVTQNLSFDFANDALEISFLISSTKKDSLNLLRYAEADLLLLQNNLKSAGTELKTLADNDNLFILNQFAENKLAEIFIAEGDYTSAIELLNKSLGNVNNAISADKSTFLLAMTYLYGTKDKPKAIGTFEKILEIFPNSIYFDHAREKLNSLKINDGQK